MADKKTVSQVSKCEGCPMRKLFPENTFVPPQFGGSTRLAIGEAPGEDEALLGKPFVGGAGRWLEVFYSKAGLKKDNITICNVIQCRPPKNVFPTDPDARSYISQSDAQEAVQHCLRAHVEPLLRGRNWTRVDLLGDKALEFIGERTEGIFKWRGSPICIPRLGDTPIAVPTLHPAYIARDQELIPCVINDLRKTTTLPPEYYTPYPDLDTVKNFTFKEFAFDIETSWGNHKDIKCVGLCAKPYFAMTVPFRGPYIPELKRIFTEAEVLIGHNCIQFDIPILFEALGIEWRPEG